MKKMFFDVIYNTFKYINLEFLFVFFMTLFYTLPCLLLYKLKLSHLLNFVLMKNILFLKLKLCN